jgi:chemotaxis protein MotB
LGLGTLPNQGQLTKEQMDKLLAQREEQKLEQAMQEVKQAIQQKIDLHEVAENVKVEITPEGLRIQLLDQDKQTMFPLGSAQLMDHTKKLLEQVAHIVSGLPNKITITGHTDSTPFKNASAGYGNWELSTDRANASRRELVADGIAENRIALVVGKADREPLMPENPAAPQNRRISIVVLREQPNAPVGRAAQATPAPAAPGQAAPAQSAQTQAAQTQGAQTQTAPARPAAGAQPPAPPAQKQ